MKKVLFILLAFISFQGFTQSSFKIEKIGLEILGYDLGYLNWEDAKWEIKNKLGDGWRLPKSSECKAIYDNKHLWPDWAGLDDYYWTSTQSSSSTKAWYFYFLNGDEGTYSKYNKFYVRPVRDLK